MSILKTIRLLHLVSYLLVASQVIFYLVVLSDALGQLALDQFIEQRKAVEPIISVRFKIIYYTCLVLCFAMVVAAVKNGSTLLIVCTAIATLCLIADIMIALKGNIPINKLITGFPADLTPQKWEALKNDWLTFFRYRGVLALTGMMALLVALVFDKNGQ